MELKSNNWILRRTDNVPVKINVIHKQVLQLLILF